MGKTDIEGKRQKERNEHVIIGETNVFSCGRVVGLTRHLRVKR